MRLKIVYTLVAIGLFAAIPVLFASFTETMTNADRVRTLTHETGKSLTDLKEAAYAFRLGQKDADQLQKALTTARNSYKKIEFLVNHFYPEYAESHLNGAPLMHIKRDGQRSSVLTPEGLQFLDELIFSESPELEKVEISTVAQSLETHFAQLMRDLVNRSISDREIITAMRRQLITVFALGVTGFDTPGSAAGLSESQETLEALQAFAKNCGNANNPILQLIDRHFAEAIAYLFENNDFETFDRLEFLVAYINPLYSALGELGKEISDNSETEKLYGAWNPDTDNLFDTDFLDPYFYSELTREEDSEELRALGKRLFNDPALSEAGTMSCITCHDPGKAFTDGRKKSDSNVQYTKVERNAPTLLNAVYADRYFYDLRAFTLEQQTEHVVFNSLEFNTNYEAIAARILENTTYEAPMATLFDKKLSPRDKLTKALTSYVLSLQSFNSPFDQFVRGETADLPPDVREGFNLFMGKASCGTCHFAPTFSGLVPPYFQKSESEILGVLNSPNETPPTLDSDNGRNSNGIKNEEAWIYNKSFKTVTVRNVALTAPYFHNGAYKSLEEVMDFYNEGGGAGRGLEVVNQTLSEDALDLSDAEIQSIITFMRALTDNGAGQSSMAEAKK